MKKILGLIALFLSFLFVPVFADVSNDRDIQDAVAKLNGIVSMNPYSLFNKSELIGYRRDQFEMSTNHYKARVAAARDRISNLRSQLKSIKNDNSINEEEKSTKLDGSLQEINGYLAEVDSLTFAYLNEIRWFMPSLTYQRYYKKFQNYYSYLNITKK
ncbi:hypothetical protein II906_00765 [bacterium]|nr:hypothetical protein [bacterium]